jgi:hypothetical protein
LLTSSALVEKQPHATLIPRTALIPSATMKAISKPVEHSAAARRLKPVTRAIPTSSSIHGM